MNNLQGLYAIADAAYLSQDEIVDKTEEVLKAGVRMIQYRDKKHLHSDRLAVANHLRSLTLRHKSLFIVNDEIWLALSCDADGVHLGKHDISIESARRQLGNNKIIGASCYESFSNIKPAIRASADYVAFGSFFPSPTKPNAPKASLALLTQAKRNYSVPVCAIGGIRPKNARCLMDAGADMIAVVSSIFSASSPSRAVQEYLSNMRTH